MSNRPLGGCHRKRKPARFLGAFRPGAAGDFLFVFGPPSTVSTIVRGPPETSFLPPAVNVRHLQPLGMPAGSCPHASCRLPDPPQTISPSLQSQCEAPTIRSDAIPFSRQLLEDCSFFLQSWRLNIPSHHRVEHAGDVRGTRDGPDEVGSNRQGRHGLPPFVSRKKKEKKVSIFLAARPQMRHPEKMAGFEVLFLQVASRPRHELLAVSEEESTALSGTVASRAVAPFPFLPDGSSRFARSLFCVNLRQARSRFVRAQMGRTISFVVKTVPWPPLHLQQLELARWTREPREFFSPFGPD